MKHLKLFFALFAMLALGVGNVWGETVTFTPSNCTNWTSSQAEQTQTIDGITLHSTGAANNTQLRLYSGATHTFTSTVGNITSILFTCTTNGTNNYGPGKMTGDGYVAGTGKTGEWTGNSATVKLTGGQSRCTSIVVTYTPIGGGETPVTVSLNKAELNLQAGTTETLTATVTGSIESVIWSSSATDVATIDNNGKVTAVAAGEATITAAIGDVKATCDVTVTAAPTPEEPGTGGEATTVTYVFKDDLNCPGNDQTWFSGTIDEFSGWTATKGTNDPKYYTTGTGLRVYNGGNFTITSTKVMTSITLTFAGTSYTFSTSNTTNPQTVTPNEKSYEWSVGRTCRLQKIEITYAADAGGSEEPTPSVSVAPTSHTFATTNVGETATQEFTITTENTTAALTASIDNTTNYAVSAITGDKVTVTYHPQSAGTHSAVLTVKAGEEATATVNLTGKAVQALEGTWILVTDASSLKAGDEIIIAAKESDVALSTTQASNNRPEVAITKNDNTITATSETQVLTLQAGNKENTLALYTGDGYLYAASSGSNWLRTETTLSDNSSWSIAVAADGTATLIAQGTNTRNTLYYNKNSKIFSCYSTTQQEIAIYKNTNGQQLAGLAYATTKYLTKLGDAFTTPTLTNPNSLTVTYSSSDNNVATVDNTGTITIKAAGVVVITAAFAGDASYLEGSAKYTLCVTEHAGTEADSYSVADARRVIDVMETAEGVYATGIVSEIVTAYNSEYGNITYNISVDGTTDAAQLQAYRGKAKDGADFTSADDIKVGDEVVVKGNLKKYNTTYEFDADNQLVSLKRDKQQAGLAYAETELTANVGEDFTEPTLTNPNSLTVTYSSSNTALATVDATTGEVSILAAGKVTITASSAADATYAAGSASYNITISDPSLAVATLPFAFNGNKAAIETTAGMTQNGLGSDYSASTAPNSQLKFDGTGDWVVIRFDSEPEKLSYDIKNNSFSGGKFSVQESADGETYTDVAVHTTITDLQSEEYELNSASRYVKFIYTTKSSGNVGLGNISITKADHRQEAGLAWNHATISLTVDDAFTAPTFSNPNSLTVSFESSNTALATVNNAGEISLVSGKTGTATITATYAGNEFYKAAAVTCVITVSPKSEKVVILAQYNGQWYALKNVEETAGKVLAALEVTYFNGTLYNVADADKATIEWQRAAVTDGIIFKNGENYIYGTEGSTDLKLSTTECAWTLDGSTYKIGNRTFIYRAQANGFKNYNAEDNAGTADYSALPVVTAPVYATGDIVYTRDVTPGNLGTICLPFNVPAGKASGATFYTLAGMDANGRVAFDEVTGELAAGVPYLFQANAAEIVCYCGTTSVLSPDDTGAMKGTFVNLELDGSDLTNIYYFAKNALWSCVDLTKLSVPANRAYVNMAEVTAITGAAPVGVRRITLGVNGQNTATSVDQVEGDNVPTKMIINGLLFILRGEKMYDAQGKLVK